MANDDWRDGGNRLIRPGQGSSGASSSSSSSGSSKGGGGSSSGSSKGGGSTSGSSSSANRGWNPGDIVTEGGKDYIRSSTGMKVPLDSDAGRRVQSQYGGSGGSKGGGINNTQVLSDYIGPNTGGMGALGVDYGPTGTITEGMRAADYLKTNYTPGSAYTSDPWGADAIARGRNGILLTRDYLEKHPDAEVYSLDYKPHSYRSTVDEFGNVYNHLGQKYGEGGVWTYDELPDHAKAKLDWNYGVSPGYSYPQNSPAYNDAYNWYNGTYGVASDDVHPLSQGQRPGGGSYWAAGGTGVGGPEYSPGQLYYSAPDGNGGYTGGTIANGGYTGGTAATGLSALSGSKLIPNTGAYGDYEDYMSDAERAALRAQREATRLAQQQYEDQIPDIQSQADEAARQAYVSMMMSKNAMPQQMAAMGYGGGLTESSLLGLNTDYENTRSGITDSRDTAMRSLRNQMAYVGAQGEMSAAQIQAQFAQQRAEQLLAQRQAQQDWERQLQLLAYQNQLDLESYEKQLQLKNKYGASSYSGGVYGDDSIDFGGGGTPTTTGRNQNVPYSDGSLPAYTPGSLSRLSAAGSQTAAPAAFSSALVNPSANSMLDRWSAAMSPDVFRKQVASAIAGGLITDADYAAWSRS